MSALKYTDRDVRENRDFESIALQYLENYEGEFAFLIDCKMRIASGLTLSTGMIRGILNCMRVDPRAPEMPDPLPASDMGEVIQMSPRKKKFKRRRYDDLPICPLTEAKLEHTHKLITSEWRDQYQYCGGYYHINRSIFHLPATVKAPFLAARGGKMIHKAEGSGHCEWYPNAHGWGYSKYSGAHLSAKTACKYPSWITQPILLFEAQFSFLDGSPVPLCRHCFSEGVQ